MASRTPTRLVPPRLKAWYADRFLPFYNRAAPAIVMFCLGASVFASVGTFVQFQASEAERVERDRITGELLDCFDEYAAASSQTSQAVRKASERVTRASARDTLRSSARNKALQAVFDYVTEGNTDPVEGDAVFADLSLTNARLVNAQRLLVVAQDHLTAVRAENPVPDPPSSFCDVKA